LLISLNLHRKARFGIFAHIGADNQQKNNDHNPERTNLHGKGKAGKQSF
jgi:hypothetical protein